MTTLRLAIVSDIHGNLPALEAAWAEIGRAAPDRVVNLGDIASGPLWPRETVQWLMAREAAEPGRWRTIAGNHERQALAADVARMGASDAYAARALGAAERAWLGALPATQWLADALSAGATGDGSLVVVESDEDVLLYETGHIPGAVKIDWHTDLNDPVTRDYIDGSGFARLLGGLGIARDTTVVIYGDKSNWWAAYALWVFTLFGHPDVRLLDGGRDLWVSNGRDTNLDVPSKSTSGYPVGRGPSPASRRPASCSPCWSSRR